VDPVRQKRFARLALLVLAALGVTWLARLNYAQKISTNVIDLIPPAEQSPEVALVRGFATDVQARVMLFALRDSAAPEQPPGEAAQLFVRALSASPAFAEAVVVGDPTAERALGAHLLEHRFELLLPSWLGERQREFARTGELADKFSAWLAARVSADLETFLNRPEATALQDILPRDPLLLMPRLVERARLLAAPGSAGGHALVWARITASPLAEEGQQPVFAAIEHAFASVRGAMPTLELRWTGINRFAAASRERIESELGLLNLFSVVAVLAVSALFVRRVYKILHLVPVILLSTLGAWTISTMVFERLHILVFVIGSLLAGVAIDYGFYIYMQPSQRPDEPYAEKLRRLLKPLLASCLTTVIGFALLLFSDLPLIRQIGVFVATGLLCALAAAMLYFAQLDRPLLEGRQFGSLGEGWKTPWLRRVPQLLFVLAMLVAVLGPWRLQWRDDVRELEIPSPALHENERALRALFGESAERSIYVTHGATVAEARERLEAFHASLAQTFPGVAAASLGLLLPTAADWTALPQRLAALPSFATDLRLALEARGFTAVSFEPFFTAWEQFRAQAPRGDYASVVATLSRALQGPLALMANAHGPLSWFLTVVEQPAGAPLPAELRTLSLSQLESLNQLFTRYRWSALRLSLAGLGLVIASVFVIYSPRRGVRIALIPAGSCFFVFGALGLAGEPLNLFHLLGAFLGVCLSHNYAIFSADHAAAATAPPVSVRLSALSTAASFGVLSFSRIPVIHALGFTVALIVITALAVVELEPLARRRAA
jgi:predicted exporter